jgi:beta-fructofuranosidase
MLMLPDAWTWDFWLADDGDAYHLFFLHASRALLDPDRRHLRAGVGHATSPDLRSWTQQPDALVHADEPAFDDLATWTGCAVARPAGGWRMFYTGLSRAEQGAVQRISWADSTDLVTWHRSGVTVQADPRWYETRGTALWNEEHWRDPWVFADPGGAGWHMLITARANEGESHDRGVVGHATSDDLENWTVQPPLSRPNAGFGQLEVMQVVEVDGRLALLFSCLGPQTAPQRRDLGLGGTWSVPVVSATGPFDIRAATLLSGTDCYAGRIATDRAGHSVLLGFTHDGADGEFVGGLRDPQPVHWQDGRLVR